MGKMGNGSMGSRGAGADNDHLTALPVGRSRGAEEQRASEKLLSILIFIRSQCRLCFSHIHGSHIHKNAQCALATVNWQAKVVI